jgi:hypothetical protein
MLLASAAGTAAEAVFGRDFLSIRFQPLQQEQFDFDPLILPDRGVSNLLSAQYHHSV